ncbi:methyltransferase family protein [Shewanella gelidii]|uniref:Isoprenylcysteine carboxyl methyltransferase n=1 Tax=Shewanella gelidii TaxID=1642821 RepID=A0A917N8U0_9GAMM|nr:isoprenylcysteine carboxylmethyltransferase family protein [Shewanella gelidii]MCL1097029.1 isoprenylcysteine carboxylmethyltransferase family protein [Shewanella gelidii]GGI72022.1 isoprenylcysteine carboxyl methyltransferase [Shewanella gelidii]
MQFMELKIPPVAQAIIAALLMWFISTITPNVTFSYGFRYIMLIACTALGLGIGIAGVQTFRRVKTTVNPMQIGDASALVNTGIYRYTRNPMYLGLAMVLFGFVILLENPLNLLTLILFTSYMTRFQIEPEERVLTEIFGKAYLEYQSAVRRWL